MRKIRDGDVIQAMVNDGVLVEKPSTPIQPKSGVILICDSETNPVHIVELGKDETPFRLIANEAGVVIAATGTRLQRSLALDVGKLVFDPIGSGMAQGIRSVVLCVNPDSISGILLSIQTIDLINYMMGAGQTIKRYFPLMQIEHVVHTTVREGSDCSFRNYSVKPSRWAAFYTWFEMETKGRSHSPNGWPAHDTQGSLADVPGMADHEDATA